MKIGNLVFVGAFGVVVTDAVGKISLVRMSTSVSFEVGDAASVLTSPSLGNSVGLMVSGLKITFNPTTTIEYVLPHEGQVIMTIYNSYGKRVKTLKNEYQKIGYYTVTWDASEQSSGLYFCNLLANGFTRTRKMMLVK